MTPTPVPVVVNPVFDVPVPYVNTPSPSWITTFGPSILGIVGVLLGIAVTTYISSRKERRFYQWQRQNDLFIDIMKSAQEAVALVYRMRDKTVAEEAQQQWELNSTGLAGRVIAFASARTIVKYNEFDTAGREVVQKARSGNWTMSDIAAYTQAFRALIDVMISEINENRQKYGT